jgi:hypothetical protein
LSGTRAKNPIALLDVSPVQFLANQSQVPGGRRFGRAEQQWMINLRVRDLDTMVEHHLRREH